MAKSKTISKEEDSIIPIEIHSVTTGKLDMHVGDLKPNKENPRIIKNENFERLKKSIADFPDMLKLRPIVIDEDNIVIGGNMRLKACIDLGFTTVPVIKVIGLTESQKKEFLVKDNKNLGDWDWDMLSNNWDSSDLNDWGFGDWKPKKVEVDNEDAFRAAFKQLKNEDAILPVIPKFDEKQELFVIVSESQVDSNWLRERLGMQKMKSYKTGEIMKSNIINVKDLYDVI